MEQNESGSNATLKWLVGILVVVVIGLIGYIVYSKSVSKPEVSTNTPTSNTATPINSSASTVDWKTYTNTRFGYTVKYPSDAKYTELTTGEEQFGQDGKKGYAVAFNINGLPIRVEASNNDLSSKTLEELIAGKGNVGVPINTDKSNINNYKVLSINGQRAFQYVNAIGDKTENGLNTVLLGKVYYYQIATSGGTIDNYQSLTAKEKETYNQFISTFQLIE